jgi:HTH-type transcriptional regulator/antitoxin HigA
VPKTESEYQKLVSLLDEPIDQVGENESHPLASLEDLYVPEL